MRTKALAITAVTALLATSALAGAPTPPAAIYGQSETHDTYFTTYAYTAGAISSVYGSASSGGEPYASASATSSSGFTYRSSVQYYFSINGAPDMPIPIIAYARMTATATGAASASVEFNIYGQTQDDRYLSTQSVSDPSVRTVSFSGPIYLDYNPLNFGGVTLSAEAASPYGGVASAFVDPLIIINPSYAAIDPDYASHLFVTVSAGIVNAGPAPAPEPSQWALQLLGLTLLGGAARRRRGRIVVQASPA